MNTLQRSSIATIILFTALTDFSWAQGNFDPYVSQGTITPSPLKPVESAGTGVISFNTGNSGSDTIKDLKLSIIIDLSNGVPDNSDPVAAIGGSAAPYYSWNYTKGSFTGNQATIIPANFSGDITVAYKVTQDSPQASPANGFRAEIKSGSLSDSNADNNVITYYTYTECPEVSPPVIGTITQPDCSNNTGSISLAGLPSKGTWTVTTYPGGATSTGNGTSTVITGLSAGTYSFTVTTADGCTSAKSADAVVNSPPAAPPAPAIGTITQPTCQTPTGSVILNDLPSTGTWTLRRYPGGSASTGSGTSITVAGLAPGTYHFTIENSSGCVSGNSGDAVINQPPDAPSAPIVGAITQPDCQTATGSVILSGLPSGSWTLTQSPGDVTTTGSGTSTTVSGLAHGSYTFRVTDAGNCTSASSSRVDINTQPSSPASPNVRIDCLLGAGAAVVTVSSPTGNGYQYQLDNGSYQSSTRFRNVSNGNHAVTVKNSAECTTTGSEFSVECGCVNGPSVTLSSRTGTTCGVTPVTVNDNTFANATNAAITTNGAGTIAPASVSSSPFSFTYTPAAGDAGKTITITFTTDNPLGAPCSAATTTYSLAVSAITAAPVPGLLTQPTCVLSTGNVALSGLPATGTWTLIRNPGNVTTTGTGSSATIQGLPGGTYTFSVSYLGCVSSPSSPVQINQQPLVPSAPVAGEFVQPTCATATGSITVQGLPASGTWTLTQYPGTINITGTGTSTNVTSLSAGTYNFTVTNASGCTSGSSSNMVINPQPPTPEPPVPGTVTVPTCSAPAGAVVLSGLPSGGWTITSIQPGITLAGSDAAATVSGLAPGTYSFTITNSAGCGSLPSAEVVIPPIPDSPVVKITDPGPACAPATVDITAPSVTAGSTTGLTYTYWINADATVALSTPSNTTSGVYYIKGTNPSSCFDIKPVKVTVTDTPVANAGPDMQLQYQFSAAVSALALRPGETGHWSVYAGTGSFDRPESSSSTVTGLGIGENVFLWTVTNGICPQVTDTLKINVKDLTVPTLLTPNNDGKNDYFILNGIESLPDNELFIFDRRGVRLFYDKNYMNDWNGVDQNGRPLMDDTYFYVLKTGDGRVRNGFIVIRR